MRVPYCALKFPTLIDFLRGEVTSVPGIGSTAYGVLNVCKKVMRNQSMPQVGVLRGTRRHLPLLSDSFPNTKTLFLQLFGLLLLFFFLGMILFQTATLKKYVTLVASYSPSSKISDH